MKILLIKMSSMGDVIHALPVLTDILNNHPNAQIDWVVEQGFSDLVRSVTPLVHRVIPIRLRAWRKKWCEPQTRQEWRAFKANLQTESYDYVIDCQGLLKSAGIAKLAKITPTGVRVGFDRKSIREPLACWFYTHRYSVSRQLPAIMRSRQLCAQALGYSTHNKPIVQLAALNQYAEQRDDWQPPKTPYAVLIPNASRVEKRWQHAHWVSVAEQCHAAGLRTVWFWGGADEQIYTEALLATLPDSERQYAEMPPFLSILQAAQCLQNATCVIGLDSGLTHLAAALGRPTLGIYCDHEPQLAPVTAHTQSDDEVASLGGIKNPPSVTSVQSILNKWLT